MIRIAVVLPAPFGPRSPTTWPLGTEKEIPFSAWTAPKVFVRSVTSIIRSSRRFETSLDCPPRRVGQAVSRAPLPGGAYDRRPVRSEEATMGRLLAAFLAGVVGGAAGALAVDLV